MADETLIDIIAAAFAAGVREEAKKQAKTSGKRSVKRTIDAVKSIPEVIEKRKRKSSAYSLKYGRAFKQIAPRFKKKDGSWKKNGFKNTQKAAHKLAKTMK